MKRALFLSICSFWGVTSFAQNPVKPTTKNHLSAVANRLAITKEIADSCYKQASFYYIISDFPNCYQNLLIYYQYNQVALASHPDDPAVQQVLHMMRYSKEEIRKGTPINKDMLAPAWRETPPRRYITSWEDSLSEQASQPRRSGPHFINPAIWSEEKH